MCFRCVLVLGSLALAGGLIHIGLGPISDNEKQVPEILFLKNSGGRIAPAASRGFYRDVVAHRQRLDWLHWRVFGRFGGV